MREYRFETARPVWMKGETLTMNRSVIARAVVGKRPGAALRVAGHTDYQIFVNGAFFAQGPARAGHGFFRVDELDLTDVLTREQNVVAVVCAGYNVNSFALTDQPSFLCAEIAADGEILFATGSERGFEFSEYTCRVRKVQRFSFQRPFTESYRFGLNYDDIFLDPDCRPGTVEVELTPAKRFIERTTLRSDYAVRSAVSVVSRGTFAPCEQTVFCGDRSLKAIGPALKGFPEEELEVSAVNELLGYRFTVCDRQPVPPKGISLPGGGFAVFDMGRDTTGYLKLSIEALEDAVVWAVFNEILPADGVPDPGSNGTACEVRWALEGGRSYELVSFEPYTYRYLMIAAGGRVLVGEAAQICEHYPACGLLPAPEFSDPALAEIYDAAVETFRQNATDIFMDCPSRERAGWLCDSFFTSRTEREVTGESRIEQAFLENFLMEETFAHLPAGMLPMCYPADHYDGTYIPNWAMWYLVELAEYRDRSGDEALVAAAKDKMYALAGFLKQYEDEFGLLEKLDSWVFVEWSRANDFVQDVNFPTNMLYAKFLTELGRLYGDRGALEKAEKLKKTIRDLAFDGRSFLDNALRVDGKLVPTGNHTETAQYYAFFSGVASPRTDPELYRTMLEDFGPDRDPETQYPDVPVANAFIGNYLRLDMLYRNGEYERLLREIRSFFLPMARRTGTLWENMHDGASCCHGFASHVAVWLRRLAQARTAG